VKTRWEMVAALIIVPPLAAWLLPLCPSEHGSQPAAQTTEVRQVVPAPFEGHSYWVADKVYCYGGGVYVFSDDDGSALENLGSFMYEHRDAKSLVSLTWAGEKGIYAVFVDLVSD